MKFYHFGSGMKCFDWRVPDEWEINNAFFVDLKSRNFLILRKIT